MNLKRFFAVLLTLVLLTSFYACGGGSSLSLECEKCGTEYKLGALYCSSCGTPLSDSKPVCSKGHENDAGAKFCAECGEALNGGNNNATNNSNSESNGIQTDSSQADNAENIWLQIKSGATDEYAQQYYYDYDGVLVAKRYYYTVTDATTVIYEYSYDEHGNMVLQACTYNVDGKPYSHTYTNKYDENGKLVSVTDYNSNVTEYKYDSNGVLTEKIICDKNGIEEHREEYENGKIKRKYGKNGYEFEDQYFYDENGRLEKLVSKAYGVPPVAEDGKPNSSNPLITTTKTYTYDGNGNAVVEKRATDYGDGSGIKYTQTTYQYMSLADYRAQGLHNILPTPNDGSVSGSGSGSSGSGGSSSNGTKCVYCEDSPGKINCFACKGTNKVYGKLCTNPSCSNGKIKCPYCGGDGIFGN